MDTLARRLLRPPWTADGSQSPRAGWPALAGLATAFTGLVALCGWGIGIPSLFPSQSDLQPVQPVSAACLLLAGLALMALAAGRRAGALLFVPVAVAAFVTLWQFATGADLGIDRLLFPNVVLSSPGPYPGRMAQATAVCFLLNAFTIGALALQSRPPRAAYWAATLSLTACLVVLTGYLIGNAPIRGLGLRVQMALPTCLALGVLSAAHASLASPSSPRARVQDGPELAGSLLAALAWPRSRPLWARIPAAVATSYAAVALWQVLGDQAGHYQLSLFFPAVLFAAVVLGRGAGVVAAIAGVAFARVFMFEPLGSLNPVTGFGDEVVLAVFFASLFGVAVAVELLFVALERVQAATGALRQQARLIDQSHDAIFTWAPAGGGILFWSRGAETLYGYSAGEAIGCVSHDLLKTESPAVGSIEAILARQGAWSGELIHRGKDGRRIVVNSRHVIVEAESGRPMVLETNRDLTASRAAEQREAARSRYLLKLEEQLRIAASARDGVTAACEVLGRELGASFVGVGELQPDGEHTVVESEWRAHDGIPTTLGRHRPADAGAERFAALSAGEVFVVEDVLTDPRTADPGPRAIYAGLGARASLNVPLMRVGRARAFLVVGDAGPRHWTDEEIALARETLDRAWHAAERARAETALADSELKLANILDALPIGVAVCAAPSGALVYGNPALETILRHPLLPTPDLAAHRLWKGYHADGRRVEASEYPMGRALATGEPADGEYRYRRGDHSEAWIQVFSAPIRNSTNETTAAVVGVLDIDEQRRAAEHQRLLVAELSHRVKNALAVVQAIASATLARSRSLEEFGASFDGRLQALAEAHGLLLRTDWRSVGLNALVRMVLAPYVSGERTSIDGPDLELGPKQGVALALTLHELATNAQKHGALSVPTGRLSVGWQFAQGADGKSGDLVLRWDERGLPVAPTIARKGLGARLIERSVRDDLRGSAVLSLGNEGLAWEIRFAPTFEAHQITSLRVQSDSREP